MRDKLSHRRSIGPEHPRPARCPVTRESDSFASRQGTMGYLHMRIALIVSPFISVPPTRYGGTELFIAYLAEGLERRGQRREAILLSTGRVAAVHRDLRHVEGARSCILVD